jgi:anti-anti-sigma factor
MTTWYSSHSWSTDWSRRLPSGSNSLALASLIEVREVVEIDLQDALVMATSNEANGSVTLTLEGEIDFGNVAQLRAELAQVIRSNAGNLTVDLAGVSFLDSTTIGVLIQAKKRLAQRESELIIIRPQPRVRRIFEMAGLMDYLGV